MNKTRMKISAAVALVFICSAASAQPPDTLDIKRTAQFKSPLGNSAIPGKFRVFEAANFGSQRIEFRAPVSMPVNVNLILPITQPSTGNVLTALTSDSLGWSTPSGTGDITSVVAGSGLKGGGESGDVTLDANIKFAGTGLLAITSDSLHVKAFGISATEIASNAVTQPKLLFGTGAGDASTLTLHDLISGSPNVNDVIKWNGANWITSAAAGSALTVREVDLNPSIGSVSVLEFLQSSGIIVTDQTGGVARIDLAGIGSAQIADGSLTGDDINSNIVGSGLTLTAGTPDIIDFAPSELLNLTFGNGGAASGSITFNLNGTVDPAITFTDGTVNISAGALQEGGSNVFTAADGSLADDNLTNNSVNDLNDVTITSAAAAQILVRNAGNTAWENVALSGDANITAAGTLAVIDDSHAHTSTSISGLDLANDLNTFSSSDLAGRLTDESGAAGVFARLNLTSPAQGDVLYFNGTNWVNLAPGISGQVLHTQGAAANPIWDTDDGAGGGAPIDATYITQTSNGTLTQEQALGLLSTGMMASVTTTGVISTRLLTGTAGAVSITNGDGSGGNPTFTLPSAITVPTSYAVGADPADAGVLRLENAALLAWESSPTGTDVTISVDASEIIQASAALNASAFTESGNAVPNATDNLSFFASTTSAQLAGVLSNETGGAGVAVFNSNPTLAGATLNGGDLTLSDGATDSPSLTFTPQTGTAWSLMATDADDDLEIRSSSTASAENIDIINPGTGAANMTVEGSITASNFSGSSSGTNTGDQTITLSGDVSGSGTGGITTTIGADKILESMLKAVNTAVDEDILTFESTTGDFEWHTPAELSLQPLEATLTDIADGTIDENLVNIANPWTVNEGGTGAATFTLNGVLYGNTTSAIQATAQGGANTVLIANAGAPAFSGQPTLATGIITKGQNAVEIDPYGGAAGNTGEIRALELAATGTNYVAFKAPDALAATTTYMLPRKGSAVTGQVLHINATADSLYWDADDGAGGGAPIDADYLVGTANGSLTNEIVVGTTPGGELGNTWASPTIDNDAVTNAKMANMAQNTIKMRVTAGAGDPEDVDISTGLTLVTAASGDYVVIEDATDGGLKRVDVGDFLGGGASWSNLSAPTATTSFVSDAVTETITFDFQSAFSADQFIVKQTIGNPTAGSLVVMQAVDADVSPIMRIDNTAPVTIGIGLRMAATNISGIITTALDLSDAEIATAIAIGSNDITTTVATIASTELDRLDGKDAALIDLNDSPALTGAWDFGSATSVEIPNVANPSTTVEGQIAWDSNNDALEVHNGTDSRILTIRIKSIQATIVDPDVVQPIVDAVSIFSIETEMFPFGITLISCGIKTDVSSTYSVNFEEWTSPTDGAPSTIELVATAATTEAEDDGTLTDASIAAGSIIKVDLPTTNIGELVVWITYVINEGN